MLSVADRHASCTPRSQACAAPHVPQQAVKLKPGKSGWRLTRKLPEAVCRNGQRRRSRKRSGGFRRPSPAPKGELEHINPFTLLVAVVLSAQATDAGVNKATPALFAAADTPAKMVALGEERVQDLIKTIGLFRTKAKNVVALSRKLLEEHGGQVPHSREALEALPGVGRKTANVVLNVAFGEPTIAVDTHIFRVGNRTGLATGRRRSKWRRKLDAIVPGPIQAPCAPLADPARALCMRGAASPLRAMPDRRSVQVAGKEALRAVTRKGHRAT